MSIKCVLYPDLSNFSIVMFNFRDKILFGELPLQVCVNYISGHISHKRTQKSYVIKNIMQGQKDKTCTLFFDPG